MNPFEQLPTHTFLAPMAGVTDKPFRQMVRHFGNHLIYTEMISATSLVYGSKNTERMVDLSDEAEPVAVQLVGNNPQDMAKAAQIAQKNGAFLIDINMGCPVRKLISNMSGVALMQQPWRAAEIVEAVKKAVAIPVTVKTRLGTDEAHQNILDFAKYVQDAGADAITIHGRTQKQGYAGKANWNMISDVKKILHIPVIANGDIINKDSAKMCLFVTNADGLMIGRGALGKPWILAEIDDKRPDFCLKDVVLEHFERLLSYYGDKGLFIARKHLGWYAASHSFVAQFRRSVYTESNKENVKSLILEFFETCQ